MENNTNNKNNKITQFMGSMWCFVFSSCMLSIVIALTIKLLQWIL